MAKKYTILQAMDDCRLQAESELALSTSRSYAQGFRVFREYLAANEIGLQMPLSKITMDILVRFPGWLARQEKLKKATMKVYLAGVKYFYDWLVLNNYLRPDYQDNLRFDKASETINKKHSDHLIRTPGKDDAEKLRAAVRNLPKDSPEKERDIALVEFLFSSGCRVAEAVGLNIRDFDMEAREVLVTGKGDKQRYVYFSVEAAEALKTYWALRKYATGDTCAFARHDRGAGKSKRPQAISTRTAQTIVTDTVLLAGLENTFTPHYFRHNFGITMLAKTANIALVQDLMGHSSADTTRRYAKIRPDDLREAHHHVFDNKGKS